MGAGRSVVLTTMAALSADQARVGGSVASLRTVRLAENEAVERLLMAPTDNIASALLVAAWQKAVAGLTRPRQGQVPPRRT